MKPFIFLLAVLLLGCQQSKNKTAALKKPGRVTDIKTPQIDSIRAKQNEEYNTDSVAQEKVIKNILQYATWHKHEPYFKKKLTLFDDTSLSAQLTFGHLFSADKKHLLVINKSNYINIYINVFVFEHNRFRSVLSLQDGTLNYIGISVRDVNGDSFKDLLHNWEPYAGCCAKDIYNVYLYLPKKGTFSNCFKFLNPTFFPAEKLIRGVDYGHPGEVPLYKYKWRGLHVDTLEYIYPADTIKERFYRVHHYRDYDDPKKRIILNSVPKEYLRTTGYSWFIEYE